MGAASIVDRKFAIFCNIARDIETYVKCRGIYGHLYSKWWQNKHVGITQLYTDTVLIYFVYQVNLFVQTWQDLGE